MGARGRAVLHRAGDGDLELARQVAELGVQGRELADRLGPDAGVVDLLGRRAGARVGCDVAHAVAGGLHRMQVDLGQRIEDVRHVAQLDPVQLQVRTRGEVAVALVPGAGDVGELAQLPHIQRAVGNGDAQHVGVQLQIETVHQPERLELVLGQLPGQPAGYLVAELGATVGEDGFVERVVSIHCGHHLRLIRLVRPPDARAVTVACARTAMSSPPSACLPCCGVLVGPSARRRSR